MRPQGRNEFFALTSAAAAAAISAAATTATAAAADTMELIMQGADGPTFSDRPGYDFIRKFRFLF